MYFPTPEELAQAIAKTSFPDVEKRLMLLKVRSMDKDQISRLYQALVQLNKEQEKFIATVEALDLKYQLKFMEAYKDSKEIKG